MERRVWASPQSPAEAFALAQAAADLISPRDGVSTSPFKRPLSSKKAQSNTNKLFEYADVRTKQAMLMEMGRTPDEALKELRHRERVVLADAGDEAAQMLVALDKREYLKVSAALGQVALLRLGDASIPSNSNPNSTRLILNRPTSPFSPRKQSTGVSPQKSIASPLSKPPPPPPKGAMGGEGSLLSPRAALKSPLKPTTPKSSTSTAVHSRRSSTTSTPSSKINAQQGGTSKGVAINSSSVTQSADVTEDNLAHARLSTEVAELELLAALGQKALANAHASE